MAKRETEGREQVTAVNCIMKGIGRKDAKEAYAKFKFQFTSAIRKAFEWEDIHGASEWEPEAPNDSFRCHFIELTPNAPELKGKALNIELFETGNFTVSLATIRAVIYGKQRLAVIVKIPEQPMQPAWKPRRLADDQQQIRVVLQSLFIIRNRLQCPLVIVSGHKPVLLAPGIAGHYHDGGFLCL